MSDYRLSGNCLCGAVTVTLTQPGELIICRA